MESIVIECYVDVDDVAILQDALVRDTMTYDLVDRSAYGLWEVDIIQRGWIRL